MMFLYKYFVLGPFAGPGLHFSLCMKQPAGGWWSCLPYWTQHLVATGNHTIEAMLFCIFMVAFAFSIATIILGVLLSSPSNSCSIQLIPTNTGGFHISLLLRNQTTADDDHGPNPFNLGYRSNVSQIIGNNWLLFCSPKFTALGDGQIFPMVEVKAVD